MEKTYSQKVARAFEIVDYILLIPSFAGLLLTIPILYWGIGDFLSERGLNSIRDILIAVFIWIMFFSGCWLLSGYYKHSRGRINDGSVRFLWVGTIIYNSIFLLPALVVFSVNIVSGSNFGRLSEGGFAIMFLLVAIWASAVFFSATALKDIKSNWQLQ